MSIVSSLKRSLTSKRLHPLTKRHLLVSTSCFATRYASTSSLKPERASSRSVYVASFGAAGLSLAAYFFTPSESRSAPTYTTKPLSPSYFTPVTLASSENLGPDTKLLTLTVPPHLLPPPGSYNLAPIWSVCIKDDDIQVERPYTPLEGIDENGHMLFWIKKYEKGEVARWLHSKNVGDTIEIRGPLMTWIWEEDAWDEVVMISGGTGITPFYQLLRNVFDRKTSERSTKARFTLLHSSRIPSELPPKSMLQTLALDAEIHPDDFKMHLFVDSLDGPTNSSLPNHIFHVGRIGKSAIRRSLGLDVSVSWWQRLLRSTGTLNSAEPNHKILFLVCGPDQMIAAIAGPYGRNRSQGKIGGVLGALGYTSSQVRKL